MHLVQSIAMADNNDVFRMLAAEDKLDGTNYPLWTYMMRHVLVAKGLWNIVKGVDVRPVVGRDAANAVETGDVEDAVGSSTAAGSSTIAATIRAPPPTAEQICWDGRDAQAHALLALSVKRAIIPHIRSCRTSKDAWDVLATLYQARNEARVAYLRKQLESEHMNEGDSMDTFLPKIKDFKEQLISADKVLSDSHLFTRF